jgi:hypothetical protein
MKRCISAQLVLAIIWLWQAPAMRAQNILANGGFESGNFTAWSTNAADSSGQVAGAAAHSGSFGAEFSETILMGDIGSEDQMTQTLTTQALTTQAGTNYILSFWANGARQSSLGAKWNGINLLTNSIYYYPFFSSLSSGWMNFQFVVQATGASTVLTFSFKASPGANNSTSLTYLDDVGVLPLAVYNQINARALGGGKVKLIFTGLPGVNYALDRTFNLLPVIQWTALSTNVMDSSGSLILTNTAVSNTNNFWRVRVVQ